MFELTSTIRGVQPLACAEDALFCLAGSWIQRLDLDLRETTRIAKLPVGRPLLARTGSRLVARALRLGAQTACLIGDDLFVAMRSTIWRANVRTGAVSLDFQIPDGRRPLQLTALPGRDGEIRLCFGEYFNNPGKGAVRIWRRGAGETANWQASYCFEQGTINHVHAIVRSPVGRVFVLTGDYGDSAAIWEANDVLDSLAPVARGKQTYRSCWAVAGDDSLVYATDSHLTENSVRQLLLPPSRGESEALATIEGSSIYHGVSGSTVIFSTTVEPGEPSGNRLRDLFERKRGAGIRSNDAVIYAMSGDAEVLEIFRATKDAYPPRLFQFGTFLFPTGAMPEDRFFAYGVGLRRYDDRLMAFRRRGV